MTISPIQLVCFDLGGVVVRICRTWEEACARAGIEVRDMSRFRTEETATRRHELVHLHQTGAMACDLFFEQIAASSGGQYSADEVRRIHVAWTMGDYPGIERVIQRLGRTPGLTTACLSNTNASHWRILHAGEGAPRSPAVAALKHRLVSHELRAAKPNHDIYHLAQRQLGFSPTEILFFDDLAENVDAARAVGWRAEVIDHTGDTAAQVMAAVVSHGIKIHD
ncbi:MAG TPA: HAD-IA family hydrolase [Phycisphaerales bacterium]|nr:HAD-IA family hydrolase [Phycisphaerales bacterium]